MNEREREFIEDMKGIESQISDGCFLEMIHNNTWDDYGRLISSLCGWYPGEYNGSEVIFIDPESGPLITDDEVKTHGVDVYKCFNEVDCFIWP